MLIRKSEIEYCPACLNKSKVKTAKIRTMLNDKLEGDDPVFEEIKELLNILKTLTTAKKTLHVSLEMFTDGSVYQISVDSICTTCDYSNSIEIDTPWNK